MLNKRYATLGEKIQTQLTINIYVLNFCLELHKLKYQPVKFIQTLR